MLKGSPKHGVCETGRPVIAIVLKSPCPVR